MGSNYQKVTVSSFLSPQFTKKGRNMIKYYKIMQGAEKVESEGFFLLS